MYSIAASLTADRVREHVLSSAQLSILADVADVEARDLAIWLASDHPAIIRCVDRLAARDHTALATMISEGDFIWGAVVYEQGEAPHFLDLIESFHVSQLDQLVVRLVELREAFAEPSSKIVAPVDQSTVT